MGPARPDRTTIVRIALSALLLMGAVRLPAQNGYNPNQFDLAPDVSIDEAPAEARRLREQAAALLAGERYEEAIDHLLRLIHEHGDKLTPLTEARFVGLAQDCQLQLLALPEPARAQYRARVDEEARRLFERGRDEHDRRALTTIVDRLLASGWGDDALWLLGEQALESGDYAGARVAWEMLVPNPATLPEGATLTRLASPAPQQPLDGVLARLVLVSILEGDLPRAEQELAAFGQQFPAARGRLGGREVVYAEYLGRLLNEARQWPATAPSTDWTTYAGDPARRGVFPYALDPGATVWRVPLTATPATDRRRGELPFFPVVAEGRVFVADETRVLAIDAATGQPAWANNYEIYADRASRLSNTRTGWGAPRYSLTVSGNRLFARLGSPETSQPGEAYQRPPGTIVCLNLKAEGRVDAKLTPDEGWAFEGPPLCDGERLYVMLRRSDVRPQCHVGCYDAETGRPLWRRFVCGAETPARGQYAEVTHGLLTLDRGSLYVSTGLGAVAALAADDGRIHWLYRYPRVTRGDLNVALPHYERDPSPPLAYGGTVFVAPPDGESILALDAAQGQLLWEAYGPTKVRSLLGVVDGRLLAGGDRLWWIRLDDGRVEHRWPDGGQPRGYGRGLIAGDQVLWPTRDNLFVFDARSALPLRDISFRNPAGDLTGGNLTPAPGRLLIATADELIALDAARVSRAAPSDTASAP